MNPQAILEMPDSALVRRDVAAQLTGGQDPRTLAAWAAAGLYPRPIRVGSVVLVRVADLREWLADPEGFAERQKTEQQDDLA